MICTWIWEHRCAILFKMKGKTINQMKISVNQVVSSPLLCDENAEFFGFGGSFGVVSPGEKLGGVFELQKRMKIQN